MQCEAVHTYGPEVMTQAVYSLHVPVTPHAIPQQFIVVSNLLLATSLGCNSLLLLKPQGSNISHHFRPVLTQLHIMLYYNDTTSLQALQAVPAVPDATLQDILMLVMPIRL